MTDEKRKKLMEEHAKKMGFSVEELERQWEITKNLESDLTVDDYKKIYNDIVSLSFDADGFGLFYGIRDRDVEKCKWIAAIMEVLEDVPASRVKHIFEIEEIEDFDSIEFIEGNK
jgi:hypothetical protein